MSDLAILIAHKHTPANDAALAVALDCIVRNTRHDYELLIDTTTPDCPYRVWNRQSRATSAAWGLFTNSDVFLAPDWDVPMLAAAAPDAIVSGVVVEPGAIGVSDRNLEKNFGMMPQAFNRSAFEQWSAESASDQPGGIGWFMPSLHPREAFLARGGFDESRGLFPEPLDEYYWDHWLNTGGRIIRVPSYSYHLQNWSNEAEQIKAVRHD